MKIVNKIKDSGINVEDLKGGEIFSLYGEFYLKLASDCCDYECFISDGKDKMIGDITEALGALSDRGDVASIVKNYIYSYNAINLKTNALTYVCGIVTPVDGELVLKGLK